ALGRVSSADLAAARHLLGLISALRAALNLLHRVGDDAVCVAPRPASRELAQAHSRLPHPRRYERTTQMNAAPMTTDRVAFDRDGYVVLPNLLDADQLDRLRSDAEGVFEQRMHTMLASQQPDDRVTWWRLPSG